MPLDTVIRDCREQMKRTIEYFDREMRGIRTGRATTALIDYVKIDYYGNHTDLRELASVSIPEPTQLLVKPFDPGVKGEIVKAIETADLGLNPMVEGGTIRINVPAPSDERRKQLMGQVKKMAEDARIAIRNERRDANKKIDQIVKDKSNHISEDEGKSAHEEVDELTKEHTKKIDEMCDKKCAEIDDV